MEKTGKFKQTFLSVVKHPQNQSLDRTIAAYRRLINDHPSFSVFNHREVVDSALQTKDPKLEEWKRWYTTLYQV